MKSSELRLTAAVESALQNISSTAAAVGARILQSLSAQSQAKSEIAERDLLLNAAADFKVRGGEFLAEFELALRTLAHKDMEPPQPTAKRRDLNLSSLEIIGDDKVQDEVLSASISQQITLACDTELRDVVRFMGAALNLPKLDESRNPIRPANIASALCRALGVVSKANDLRQILAREFGRTMAEALRGCYRSICEQLRAEGVQPLRLGLQSASGRQHSPRTTEAPLNNSAQEVALPAIVESAMGRIQGGAEKAAEAVILTLMAKSSTATRITERDVLIDASMRLRREAEGFVAAFGRSLRESALKDLQVRKPKQFQQTESDWMSMSLVDDRQVDEQVFATRIGNVLAHACEAELRELLGFLSAVLDVMRVDESRNPIRPGNIGQALYFAISSTTQEREHREALAVEFGQAMARTLRVCYQDICQELQSQGVQPVGFTVKTTGSGRAYPAPPPTSGHGAGSETRPLPLNRTAQDRAADISSQTGALYSDGRVTEGQIGGSPGDAQAAGSGGATPSNLQLMALLRQLNQISGQSIPMRHGARIDSLQEMAPPQNSEDDLDGLTAPNLIRAHRQELIQTTAGKLDHMVIDIVASLFDQILSDPKVPPQMARIIARLQLPVLRVALNDHSFFSSRKHPVRRLVNRMASLACAYDDFSTGPAEQLLARVRELTQEIVDGEFDQLELYDAKLAELEGFVADLAQSPTEEGNPAGLLASKESELHMQQCYMQQLWGALKPFDMPGFLREFICQVWSQALMMACRQAGPDDALAVRLRKAGRDVILSVLPKGSGKMRKQFIMQLPQLMKSLKEGMTLIGWPEIAQDNFFGELLPSHAASLNQAPMRELDLNLLARELDTVFAAPIPGAGAPILSAPLPAPDVPAVPEETIGRVFTPEEAERVGLVDESAVDWSREVETNIDLSDAPKSPDADGGAARRPEGDDTQEASVQGSPSVGLHIAPAEPPHEGAKLVDHLQLGFAYHMILQDEWKKVRLSFISPGRTLFAFTRGINHQEVISVTARMLYRMCDSGRLRAVEHADLMERATLRARDQLAAIRHAQS